MTQTIKNIAFRSIMSQQLRHPSIWLPPHNNNFANLLWSVNTTMASVVPATYTVPVPVTLKALRHAPGACNVNVTITTGGGFTSAMRVDFQVVGLDENHFPQKEIIRCLGTAAATQGNPGLMLFSRVDQVNIVGVVGAASGSGSSFAVMVGDGSATFAFGGNVAIPHPQPGLPVAGIYFVVEGQALGATGLAGVIPAAVGLGGKSLIFSGANTNYGVTGLARLACPIFTNIDGYTLQ